jgi:hypothetical protein
VELQRIEWKIDTLLFRQRLLSNAVAALAEKLGADLNAVSELTNHLKQSADDLKASVDANKGA